MADWDESYQATSIVSVIGSSLVVLTLLLFKTMRTKLFMRIIANISMADILGNLVYTTQYRPADSAFWCSMQGFLNLYSYPCSWLWTTMLVQFLYDLAVYQRIRVSFRAAFLFCWGVPLVVTLLYIAFIPHGTYERHDGNSADSFCTYGGHGNTGFIWHVISYYGVFLVCVLYMAFLYTKIRMAYAVETKNIITMNGGRDSAASTTSSATLNGMKMTSDSLLLNPIIMITLWTPHILAVVVSTSLSNTTTRQFSNVALSLKIMHGFATAVLFFYKSQVARNLWIRLLCCRYKFKKTEEEELDEMAMCRESENSISDYRVSDASFMVPSPSIASLAIANPLGRTVGNEEL